MKLYFFKVRKVIFSLAITGVMAAAAEPVFANNKKDDTILLKAYSRLWNLLEPTFQVQYFI